MTPPAVRRLLWADAAECAALTDLCMMSKAHWGYDAAFMAACRPVLTIATSDIARGRTGVTAFAGGPGGYGGMVRVVAGGDLAHLQSCFVVPAAMGRGHGRALMAWAAAEARGLGADALRIEADPGAAAFYERLGAVAIGTAPSEAIPGRTLPLLRLDLG